MSIDIPNSGKAVFGEEGLFEIHLVRWSDTYVVVIYDKEGKMLFRKEFN